jgi:hypothetical protein
MLNKQRNTPKLQVLKEFHFLWGLAKNIILILKEILCFGWGLKPPIANAWIRPWKY